MANEPRKFTALPLLHLAAVIAVAIWWGIFMWRHTPARDVFNLHRPTPNQLSRAGQRQELTPRLQFLESSQTERALAAARVALGDLLFGSLVLGGLAVGSGIYVRRLDNWLRARSSGDAVALRGTDLAAATIEANTKKAKGVIR